MHEHCGLPFFENDLAEPGVIEAHMLHEPQVIAPVAVLCFFHEVLKDLVEHGVASRRYTLRSEIGANHIYELNFDGRIVSVLQPGVGAPLAVGFAEEAAALGITTFVACGGAGALDAQFDLGQVMVVESALRDEGTSAHYVRPTRVIEASPLGVEVAHRVLDELSVAHFLGRVWTTDAIFRETPSRVQRRVEEGCHMVDMEASALIAMTRYRQLRFAHVLYAGDMVVGESWDQRHWDRAQDIRQSLFWAAVEIALALHDASDI